MSCVEEAEWILRVLRDCRIAHEVWVSFSLGDTGYLRDGGTLNEAVRHLCAKKRQWGLNLRMLSINCCMVEAVSLGLDAMMGDAETVRTMQNNGLSLAIYPNAMESIRMADSGFPVPHDIREDMTPQIFYDQFVTRWLTDAKYRDLIGAIGGCCGFEPKHIAYVTSSLKRNFPRLMNKPMRIASKL